MEQENYQKSLYGELAACCLDVRIESQTERELQALAVFVFPESYSGFKGHFPAQPILPAIIQIAMVRYLAEDCLGRHLNLKSCSRTKFRAMVQPQVRVTVKLELQAEELGWLGRFNLTKEGGEPVASGVLQLV